jgi:hypothetical protein
VSVVNGGAEKLGDLAGIPTTTSEDVHGCLATLGPGVDADVRLGEQDDAGQPLGLKLVNLWLVESLQSKIRDRPTECTKQTLGVVQMGEIRTSHVR